MTRHPPLALLVASLAFTLVACGPMSSDHEDAGGGDASTFDDAGPADDAGVPEDASGDAGGDPDAGLVEDAGGSDAGPGCDSDGDGTCDDEDLCPGFDDRSDTDGDGRPDGCDCDTAEICGASELCTEIDGGVDCELDADGDGVPASLDCDDTEPTVHPGAMERCDGFDTDCDPLTEEPSLSRDGAPAADLHAAIAMGGLVEICDPLPLRNPGDSYTNPVTIVGRTADAEIIIERGVIDIETITARIEALRVRRSATATGNGGVRVRLGARLELQDAQIEDMLTSAINASGPGSVVEMTGGRIANNRSSYGAIVLERATGTFTNVVFEDNVATSSSRGAGAMWVHGSSANGALAGCTMHRNRTTGSGTGAILVGESFDIYDGTAYLDITGGDFGAAGGVDDNDPHDLIVSYGVPAVTSLIVSEVTSDLRCTASSSGNTCVEP